ncbi:hypothetical protein L249_6857 [Ophiocordyceps polyrhachis-furcata BCC 54312]|uniref:dihydroneopterin aldolase n=1 Tax=Ophiocordyceps polyrhachis-furcata BCC 54312 TaxID=1330021 RepID=A0A367LJG1_9HYPO|nr:hypothetical protein L249_6857 [Ophiocordyceps polyrhachis-furcata BCC 54312]
MWPFRRSHQAMGEAPAIVRVRGLQTTVKGPHDAWGRPGRPQPMLMSAEVALQGAFAASSSQDALAVDTVHYGQLSKAIRASVERLSLLSALPEAEPLTTLFSNLALVWRDIRAGDNADVPSPDADIRLLDVGAVSYLLLTAFLPKASLLGDGVSLVMAGAVSGFAEEPTCALGLHGLRVPTLIGINGNERRARQTVVISVEIDNFDPSADNYHGIEARVVEETAASSFDTLEALAAHLLKIIARYLRAQRLEPGDGSGSRVTIIVEKPMAVPFADAPAVELRLNTNDVLARRR